MATKKAAVKKVDKLAESKVEPKGLTYAEALNLLGQNQRVTRPSFGEGSFIFHGQPFVEISFVVNEISQQVNASAHYNVPFKSGGVLCKKTDEIEVGWDPSPEDTKAKDWVVV